MNANHCVVGLSALAAAFATGRAIIGCSGDSCTDTGTCGNYNNPGDLKPDGSLPDLANDGQDTGTPPTDSYLDSAADTRADGPSCTDGADSCNDGGGATCGGANQPCCAGACSSESLACLNQTCLPCGQKDQPCCASNKCEAGISCASGTCSRYFIGVTLGARHSCGIVSDGTVRCWGDNSSLQVGAGTTESSIATPVTVPGLPAKPSALSAGQHTCALYSNGTVQCWGDNSYGQLGDGSKVKRGNPVAPTGLPPILTISAGSSSTCVVTNTNTGLCWGYNMEGLLTGPGPDRTAPTAVPKLSGAQSLHVNGHACALMTGGKPVCWGSNKYGQLGVSDRTDSAEPVAVSGLTGVREVLPGSFFTCALRSDNSVQCWGMNSHGNLGAGREGDSSTPLDVVGLGANVKQLAVGGFHSCALLNSGAIRCWGLNNSGQLGDGSTTNRGSSVSGPALAGVQSLALGAAHSCALLANGTLQCWGHNDYGQLGDGTKTARSTAAVVSAP